MIAVDWGTTSLRAFRLDAAGNVLEQRRSARGVLAASGRFAEVLHDEIGTWDDCLVVLAGMVGSRQGWYEMPYVDCPASIDALAAALQRVPDHGLAGRDLWIVPGLRSHDGDGVYDVMRGEETQICGVLDELGDGHVNVCLPGTHSKHASVVAGRIEHFTTSMTGEVFALLCEHSLLGRLMRDGEHDAEAFARGVAHAQRRGDLLQHLFAARTLGLFNTLRAEQLRSFLSGLLIGHELNDLADSDSALHLIGAPGLLAAYQAALAQRGVATQAHAELASARGCYTLARHARLL